MLGAVAQANLELAREDDDELATRGWMPVLKSPWGLAAKGNVRGRQTSGPVWRLGQVDGLDVRLTVGTSVKSQCTHRCSFLFPLPEGEGQGEGCYCCAMRWASIRTAQGLRIAYNVSLIGVGTPTSRARRTTVPVIPSSSTRFPAKKSFASEARPVPGNWSSAAIDQVRESSRIGAPRARPTASTSAMAP